MVFVAIGAIVLALAIMAFICWLLMGCLKRIPPQYRKMEPGMVWLMMIPCFNIVWAFFIGLRIPESFQAYFAAQGRTDVGDCGRGIGLAYAICGACSIVPYIGVLPGLASLVLLIIFLVKMTGYKNEIPEQGAFTAPLPPPSV